MIVYDDALLDHADDRLFDAHAAEVPAASVAGRGTPRFVSVAGRPCVLRHYYRGGMIRRFNEDSFFWAGEDRTRSFHEWRLLAELRRQGLPVPRPVAARYRRRGLSYSADLITERLPGVSSLADHIRASTLAESGWRNVGATIARFHAACVYHADLNAHNVQIDAAGEVFLLDLDRGSIRPGSGAWTQGNLDRLRRSVDKVYREAGVSVEEKNWSALLAGYRDSDAGPA